MAFTDRKFNVEIQVRGCSRQRIFEALCNLSKRNIELSMNDEPWTISNQENFKVISPTLFGKDGLNIVKNVIHSLSGIGSRVDSSCSFIVNVDIKDFFANDLKTLIKRYNEFEKDIDSFMPPSRRGNGNFVPLIHNYQSVLDEYYDSIYAIADHCRDYNTKPICKINIHNLNRTNPYVSYKHHSGTLNYDKAINWINFVVNFTEMSKEDNRFQDDHAFAGLSNTVLNYYITRTQQFRIEIEEQEIRRKHDLELRNVELKNRIRESLRELKYLREYDTLVRTRLFTSAIPGHSDDLFNLIDLLYKNVPNLTNISYNTLRTCLTTFKTAIAKNNPTLWMDMKLTYHELVSNAFEAIMNDIISLERSIKLEEVKAGKNIFAYSPDIPYIPKMAKVPSFDAAKGRYSKAPTAPTPPSIDHSFPVADLKTASNIEKLRGHIKNKSISIEADENWGQYTDSVYVAPNTVYNIDFEQSVDFEPFRDTVDSKLNPSSDR